MNGKLIGGVMLIVGTSMGGGMLALPIAMASGGFFPSFLLLVVCWLVMLLGALLFLEVNLWLPDGSNLISMAGKTLGKSGQAIAWVSYLLLLYALLAAYIAAGTDITQAWLSVVWQMSPSKWLSSVSFTAVMGYIVYRGIIWVDIVNRGLLSSKFLFCIALIIFLAPFVNSSHLLHQNYYRVMGATTIVVTSFGFATLVPSLRTYFNSDLRKLRFAIVVGSFIPLCFYIAWSAVVQGILPINGSNGLIAMQISGNVTVQLADSLTNMTHNSWINWTANFFTSICVLTSFLGVALSLSDFLADGCKVYKAQYAWKIVVGALLPSLVLVCFIPALFIKALDYAGILCVILLILLPALMVYRGRYVVNIANGYQVKGGKILLLTLIIFSLLVITLKIIR